VTTHHSTTPMSTLVIFEDEHVTGFGPLALTRPVFELVCGMTSLREKITRAFPRDRTVLLCRSYLAPTLREQTCLAVNDLSQHDDDCLFVNGRALLTEKLELATGDALTANGELVAVSLSRVAAARVLQDGVAALAAEAKTTRAVDLPVIRHPWELIARQGEELAREFATTNPSVRRGAQLPVGSHVVGERSDLFIEEGATVLPGVVFDVSGGPIYVGHGVTIRPPTYIQGPACIGEGGSLDGAQIRAGTTLGPRCGVGGEVSASVFLEGANKKHAGFVGHSYLGAYVNCGALTTTSNLKNNTKSVRVQLAASTAALDTGQLFVGSCIGDHTMLGIGTLLNTGAVVGCGCNVFGGGVSPKYIPSFMWGGNHGFVEHQLDKMLETTAIVRHRRGVMLTEAYRELLARGFDDTAQDRGAFFASRDRQEP